MSVTSVEKDLEAVTLTVIADFTASVEAVWDLWADPRKLEKWWGPPMYPATFVQFDLTPGSTITYFMTSPEGDKHYGFWRVQSVDAPKSIEVLDGFADADGNVPPDAPFGHMRMELSEHEGGTRMTLVSTNETVEELEELVAMGMVEGMTAAVAQMDALLV